MDTNKNSYTIIYASVMVIVVAFLLAFVSSALKPTQDQNVELDKKKQILASLGLRDLDGAEAVEKAYSEAVVCDLVVDSLGNVLKDGKNKDKDGFVVPQKEISPSCLPVYVCKIKDETKYVIPMTGRGLWGGLWGYMAINADLRTVFGAYFSHESETAGLGALIADKPFQEKFIGKNIFAEGDSTGTPALFVVKNGKVEAGKEKTQVDGITGATLTSVGVSNMVQDGLKQYVGYFKSLEQKR